MRIQRALLAVALLWFTSSLVYAQEPSASTVTIVVPFAPAGPNDLLARSLAERLGTMTGRKFIVENKAGAAGIIGADSVARARADGNTLLFATQTTLVANPFLYKSLPYDPANGFVPAALVAQQPLVLVVPASSAATSGAQLVNLIRNSPNPYVYASAGNGTIHHLSAELLRANENLQLVHVPYKGSAPALIDLIAGRVQFMFIDLGSVAAHIKSGALRPLLVAGPNRLKSIPQVPTSAEAGLKSLSLIAWAVLAAPAGTPTRTIEALNRDVNAAIQKLAGDDHRFADFGVDLRGNMTVLQVADFIKSERPVWEQVIRRSGATAE